MSNDLEDFLRQAAEMRQRKQAERRADEEQQRDQQTRSGPLPYTNARRERAVEEVTGYYDELEEEILDERDVEILDAVHLLDGEQDSPSREGASSTSEPSARAAMPEAKIVAPEHGGSRSSKISPAASLREMLRQPDGLRQAFLIREILNRPRF